MRMPCADSDQLQPVLPPSDRPLHTYRYTHSACCPHRQTVLSPCTPCRYQADSYSQLIRKTLGRKMASFLALLMIVYM